ncbi:MAG: pilus assembly protein TadG-related protein, partial [Anaerolineaceae bacterium]
MKRFNPLERGQVVVIVVMGVTALLAFTALALDGGQYYADRRHTQNAADDAALAGAGKIGDILAANGISTRNFSCSNAAVASSIPAGVTAAQNRAQQNGFTIDDDLINAQHGVEVTCSDNPKQLKVRVKIISDVRTSFLHMIFSAILHNTVEAVTIVEPGKGLGDGMAVVSLETEGCGGQYGGIFFGGSGTSPEVAKITINNSGAHSNSCIRCLGSSVTIDADKSLELASDIASTNCKDTSIWGEGLAVSNEVVELHTPQFKCGEGAYVNMPAFVDSKLTLEPGNYKSIKVTNNQTLTLKSGLYCVSGVIDVGGTGSIVVAESAADPAKDDGVTL